MLRMLMRTLLQRLFHNTVAVSVDSEAASIASEAVSSEPVWTPAPKNTSRSSVSVEVPLIADPTEILFKRVPTPEPSSMQPHPTYVCDVDESVNYVGMFYKG